MANRTEIRRVFHAHHYDISIKTATWASMAVILLMTLLFPILSFPPTFGSYGSDMYFHSIGLSMVALVVCLIMLIFDLQKHEPALDFPLQYRALITTLLAALAGIFYLTPALSAIPQIPTILFVLAVLFTIDITGAVLVELLLVPRKLFGRYSLEELKSKFRFPKYYIIPFLFNLTDLKSMRKMGAAYMLVVVGLVSLFIGELIGLVLLWVSIVGPSFLGAYVNSFGGISGTVQSIMDPHSHGVAVALMAIVIGLVVESFGVLKAKGWKKNLARIGMWLSGISMFLLILVYLAGALVNYAPPTFFQSGPNGINGIAGDDSLITMVFMGGILSLVPLALTKFNGRSSFRDALRASLLFTLLMWLVANAMAGFFIELNENSFSTNLAANDAAFSQFQPMVGIFFLTIIAMVLLAADYYGGKAPQRKLIGWSAGIGVLLAVAGGLSWVFIDSDVGSWYFWAYILGILVVCVSILLAIRLVYMTKIKYMDVKKLPL